MKNPHKVRVGDILVFPACNTKAYFEVVEIINPLIHLVGCKDFYGNDMTFDIGFANCRKANIFERLYYRRRKNKMGERQCV